MSKFYGTLVGARGEATRCGTYASGIKASVQAWDGSCITRLTYDNKDNLMLTINTSKESTGCFGDQKYYGTLEDFNRVMDLVRNVGTEKSIDILTKTLKG